MNEIKMINICRACNERLEEASKVDKEYDTSCRTCSTTSLSSYDRSISSSSDTSVDVNVFRSSPVGISAASSPKCCNCQSNGLQRNSEPALAFDKLNSMYFLNSMNNEAIENFLTIGDSSHFMTENHEREGLEDIKRDNLIDKFSVNNTVVDSVIWVPPEPENPDDDIEGSLSLNDDEDDDYVNGMNWGTSSSLSSLMNERDTILRFQERQKKLVELKNGKFTAAIYHFLKNDMADFTDTYAKSWLHVIVALSWEAASFLKPDSIREATMDPDGYVKVKCIATGHRSESKLVKGVVFSKHVAHKHMITKLRNPRFLLIRGALGQSSSVLSSFTAMDQENENAKSLMDLIERCHPNVVLVEKSVSRDIQESMLAKGITLVYDMKLQRLQRIARCTGSPIFSSESLTLHKLRSFDSFYIEKFVEEHALSNDGGKRSSKTLLFVEGCPTHLGCTILLKGSHFEELKRIKNVVLYAAITAFHLLVETSFIMDCGAMYSSVLCGAEEAVSQAHSFPDSCSGNDEFPLAVESASETEIPVSDGPVSNGTDEVDSIVKPESSDDYIFFTEPYNPAVFSGLSTISTSLKKVFGSNFPYLSYSPSLSNFLLAKRTGTNVEDRQDWRVNNSLEADDETEVDVQDGSPIEDLRNDISNLPLSLSSDDRSVRIEVAERVHNDDFSYLTSSTLVLKCSRNGLKGTVCEPNRFSHMMFYRNFDDPLCKVLLEKLLNQRYSCTSCGDSPESHIYSYTHHNKQLMIRVQRLAKDLPRKLERKIWMWSRCGKCQLEREVPICTKRVLVSSLGKNLSFGKFLELSFSFSSLSGMALCGHSLEKDFYYFFGEGPVVAMLKYSEVATYAVSLPPTKLESKQYIGNRIWTNEFKTVYANGKHLFNVIGDSLKNLNAQGSWNGFSFIEEMLKYEISEFEANIHHAATCGIVGKTSCIALSLNWLLWGLLLRAYVWHFRLDFLHATREEYSSTISRSASDGKTSSVNVQHIANDGLRRTIEAAAQDEYTRSSNKDEYVNEDFGGKQASEDKVANVSEENHFGFYKTELNHEPNYPSSYQGFGFSFHQALQFDSPDESTIKIYANSENSGLATTNKNDMNAKFYLASTAISEDWFWMPFSEIQKMYMTDLQHGLWPKFQHLGDNHFMYPATNQWISDESSRIHVPIDDCNYIVRDYDGEHSSVIACALGYLKETTNESMNLSMRESSFKSSQNLQIFARVPTMILPEDSHGNITGTDAFRSNLSISLDDSPLSSFDGLRLLESVIPIENLSPEVNLGVTKFLPKGKYSVICLYAKQFSDLRNRFCFPELDYIASLSRCRNWDAKGGKSKSAFSKTHDERFIIKEIKKIEFESFLKFAPHYFKYMKDSIETGSQSCLAKVLGIYQVIIRQSKGGKETRHDLMVMENLSYGRQITRQYDLKGALHARFTSTAENEGDVLLDQNFVNDMACSPLYVSKRTKQLLERAVWNDTYFLNSINVMDYSLLVGVDSRNRVLNCGIIDYLRQYTWDKQLETWVKSSLVVPKNVQPTVISPREYKKRFRKFISKHFLCVPDDWCAENSSAGSCDLCGCKDLTSTRSRN